MAELNEKDQPAYTNFMRITPEIFTEIECCLTPDLQKQLCSGLKLGIILRHLATRESYVSLQFAFRVERLKIYHFISDMFDTIIRYYHDEVVACPILPEAWLEIEQGF